jgi:hypothetical protein
MKLSPLCYSMFGLLLATQLLAQDSQGHAMHNTAADGQAATEVTDEHEGLGVHQHGHAMLTLVLEGNEMQLAFQSAAQSIVGFEHKPQNSEQKQEVAAAIAVFEQAQWFGFNNDANCELSAADASSDLSELHARAGHADFYANYQLLCQRPARLKQLQLSIFNLIPVLEQVDVQWSLNGQQGAAQATLNSSIVTLQ